MTTFSPIQYLLIGLAAIAGGLVNALAGGGTLITFSLSEIGPDGASRVVEAIEPLRCGMGAVNGRDGVDARDNSLNNMRNHLD